MGMTSESIVEQDSRFSSIHVLPDLRSLLDLLDNLLRNNVSERDKFVEGCTFHFPILWVCGKKY
jgi:hypothetical protein